MKEVTAQENRIVSVAVIVFWQARLIALIVQPVGLAKLANSRAYMAKLTRTIPHCVFAIRAIPVSTVISYALEAVGQSVRKERVNVALMAGEDGFVRDLDALV